MINSSHRWSVWFPELPVICHCYSNCEVQIFYGFRQGNSPQKQLSPGLKLGWISKVRRYKRLCLFFLVSWMPLSAFSIMQMYVFLFVVLLCQTFQSQSTLFHCSSYFINCLKPFITRLWNSSTTGQVNIKLMSWQFRNPSECFPFSRMRWYPSASNRL